MALPAEPRQKMINIMYLVLTAILALNVSAEILNAFKVVDSSLAKSNVAIDKSNENLFASLKGKMEDPSSREKATIWNAKAEQAKKMADVLYQKIEGFKDSLRRASGYNPEKNLMTFKEDDIEAPTHMFIVNKRGPELKADLENLKTQLLNLDPAIAKEFATKLPIDVSVPPSTTGSENTWEYNYFHMTPTIAALTILSKFENDIKNAENQIVTYCHSQVGAVKIVFDKFQPIANANSTYLMPGQELVVQAGVGAFNSQAKPNIIIDGVATAVNDNGVAEKKFNVSGAGPRKVHVVINYVKPDGTNDKLEKDIDYTVGTPGGAAASADKMNVFYIGVDNPVTVASPTGWDRTNVVMSGGTLSGSNGKYVAKVSTPGKAIINVTANNTTTPFEFRVKTIPDPIGMVGPSKGGRMQSNIFKAQDFLRAELIGFDFDAKFSVTSATVYFAGAGFTTGGGVQTGTLSSGSLAPVKAKMDLCKPGSTVTFDDLKVVGPDGRTRTIPPISFVLF